MVAGHSFQEQGYNNSACQNQCSFNIYNYPPEVFEELSVLY
jgi:hypothetical protein